MTDSVVVVSLAAFFGAFCVWIASLFGTEMPGWVGPLVVTLSILIIGRIGTRLPQPTTTKLPGGGTHG